MINYPSEDQLGFNQKPYRINVQKLSKYISCIIKLG
jgi:hypothetical protein